MNCGGLMVGQGMMSHQGKLITNQVNTGLVATTTLEAYQEISHESSYVFFALHKLYFSEPTKLLLNCFSEPPKISELLRSQGISHTNMDYFGQSTCSVLCFPKPTLAYMLLLSLLHSFLLLSGIQQAVEFFIFCLDGWF